MGDFVLVISSIVLGCFGACYAYMRLRQNQFNTDNLRGQNVLVTGGSSGIGKAVALQYAKCGANVFITARREKELQEVVTKCKEVGSKNGRFHYTAADMASFKTESQKVIKEAVDYLGSLDHIILNHALMDNVENTTGWTGTRDQLSNFEAQLHIGLMSYVHLTAHALPYLEKAHPGRIAVIGSIAGKTTFRCMPSYCALKFALDGFFGSLREMFEHGGKKISVTYHVLGPVDTGKKYDAIPGWLCNPKRFTSLMSRTTPETVAEEIVKATALGKAEMYFPHLFGYIPGGYRILPLARHLAHSLLYGS